MCAKITDPRSATDTAKYEINSSLETVCQDFVIRADITYDTVATVTKNIIVM